MVSVIKGHFLPAVLAIVLFVAFLNGVGQIGDWVDRRTPAISWQGVETMTQTVSPGGVLTVEYTATINKQCPSDLRSFIEAPDGTVPIRFPVVAGGYAKPTEEPRKIRVSVTIPGAEDSGLAPLRSGVHTYRTVATRYCPEGVEEDTSVPDAKFHLEVERR